MNGIMKKLIKHFSENQKTLFLIDSIGAFITAFSLLVIVRQFNEYFGIPKNQLTYLSIIAVLFSIYSGACFFFLKGGTNPFLKLIGVANIIYCALTIGLLINYKPSLTILGITYFLFEIIIICGLSFIEINVANRNTKK